MKNNILVIYECTCFIFFLQYVYTYTVNIESTDIPDEFIHRYNTSIYEIIDNDDTISELFHPPYFCKGSVCVRLYEYESKPFLELPDKNGHNHLYILNPYWHPDEDALPIQLNDNETVHVSLECKIDSQCFSNKCVNHTCERNLESNFEWCDEIFSRPTIFSDSRSYIHCGKSPGEPCTTNSECASENCGRNPHWTCSSEKCERVDPQWLCIENNYMPYDSDVNFFNHVVLVTMIIISLIIVSCCCCYSSKKKKNKKTKKQKHKSNIK